MSGSPCLMAMGTCQSAGCDNDVDEYHLCYSCWTEENYLPTKWELVVGFLLITGIIVFIPVGFKILIDTLVQGGDILSVQSYIVVFQTPFYNVPFWRLCCGWGLILVLLLKVGQPPDDRPSDEERTKRMWAERRIEEEKRAEEERQHDEQWRKQVEEWSKQPQRPIDNTVRCRGRHPHGTSTCDRAADRECQMCRSPLCEHHKGSDGFCDYCSSIYHGGA